MRGISTIIAVILMVVITVALATLTMGFLMGWFKGRVAVVLEAVGEGYCQSGATTNAITLYVRNVGEVTSGALSWANFPGNPSAITGCTFSPTYLASQQISTVTCSRATTGTGIWKVIISAPGTSPVTASAYCAA